MSSTSENLVAFAKFVLNFVVGMSMALWYMVKGVTLWFVPRFLRYKDVSNDIVLITGGGSGLGRLFALTFAKKGAKVVIWDVNLPGMEETAKMIEELRTDKDKIGSCAYYVVDISDRAEVYARAEQVKREIGTVTILINNAGIVVGKRFMDLNDDKIVKTFEVNCIAHFWMNKAFLPGMMEKNHGHIVSIASIAGLVGAYQLTDYCASKFGAVGLQDSLRLELLCDGYDGIHTTVVCPYYINTGMFSGIGRSIIPVLTPEYVVGNAVKSILVNDEVCYLPGLINWMLIIRTLIPSTSFDWFHKATGAASTMKSFTGRQPPNPHAMPPTDKTTLGNNKANSVTITMLPPDGKQDIVINTDQLNGNKN